MVCWLRQYAKRPILCCHDLSTLSSHSSDKFISQICLQMWHAMKDLRKIYCVAYVKVDSAHLGDPACRRRVYIIMVRRQALQRRCQKVSQQSVNQWQLSFPAPARDVILQKLKNHNDLESHCLETYKKLRKENPVAISVPLRSRWQNDIYCDSRRCLSRCCRCCLSLCCLPSVACPAPCYFVFFWLGSGNSEARADVAEGLPIPEDNHWAAGGKHSFQAFQEKASRGWLWFDKKAS